MLFCLPRPFLFIFVEIFRKVFKYLESIDFSSFFSSFLNKLEIWDIFSFFIFSKTHPQTQSHSINSYCNKFYLFQFKFIDFNKFSRNTWTKKIDDVIFVIRFTTKYCNKNNNSNWIPLIYIDQNHTIKKMLIIFNFFLLLISFKSIKTESSSFDSLISSQCKARCLSLYPWKPTAHNSTPFSRFQRVSL